MIDPAVLLLLLLSIHYLISIGIILRTNALREWRGRFFLLTLGLSLVGTVGQAGLRAAGPGLEPTLERVLLYGMPLLALAFLGLTRAFVGLKGMNLRWLALGGGWLVALAVVHGDLFSLPAGGWVGRTWSLGRPLLTRAVVTLGWGAFALRAGFLTARIYATTKRPLHRNRLRFWLLIVGIHVGTAGLIVVGWTLPAAVLHLAGMVVASYVILTHDLPDIVHTARRALSYGIVTLVTAEVYTGAFLVARALLGPSTNGGPVVAAAVASLGLAAFIGPLMEGTRRLVDDLVSGGSYDATRIVREYSARVSNRLELEELARAAMGLIAETMGVERGALFVVQDVPPDGKDDEGSARVRLRGVLGVGEGPLPPHTLSREGVIAGWLNHEHRPLTQYDVDLLPRFEDVPPDDQYWLERLDMDVFVPIQAEGEWIGLLAVGSKGSGEPFFDADLLLLSTLADQTAVALENARLFMDLKQQNAENERLNEELTAANLQLARLDQTKSDLIDIASHELRTPLTQIIGYNEILEEMLAHDSLTAEAGLEMTGRVRRAAKRLEDIVDTMFDVSQLDTSSMEIVKSAVDVGSLIGVVLKEWEHAFRARDLTVRTANLRRLPMIEADRGGLRKVFSHLIQNAIKYTPDGGTIRVEGRVMGADGPVEDQAVEIVVTDSGIGIAEEDLDRVFDTFYRVGDVMRHSTGRTSFKGGGPGLGLAIARGIVQVHGGRIWAESAGCDEESCPGAAFHVLLPVDDSGWREGLV